MSRVQVFATRFVSQCEHHLLPFYGSLKVAYATGPGVHCPVEQTDQLQHVVRMFSRRLQVQERLTQQVAQAVQDIGCGSLLVLCESTHMCMVARGVEEHASTTITTATRGQWAADATTRAAALQLLLHSPSS